MTAHAPTFDELTRTAPGEHGAAGTLPVDAHWAGFGGAHGGLMVAALGRAMEQAAGRPLRSIHADLLSGVRAGELELSAGVDRAGRTVSYASAAGRQEGALRLRATGVLGDGAGPFAAQLGFTDHALEMPPVPAPGDCPEWKAGDGPALKTVRFRPASGNLPLSGGLPEFHVWLALADDDAPLDPWRLLTLCDAPAPGLYGLVRDPFAIPTVELTAQLLPAAREPTGRWTLARMRTVSSADGWSVDDCELWDETGRPLLVSRQTRRIPA
ncbi:MAG: thioesterase family protein [Solirubrobacteraceae bacterium]|nr:thioesterase family protein [Solirubrobacteraceae bacterium]